MLENTHNDGGNILRRNVYAIELYPDKKISTGYISIEEEGDRVKIFISSGYLDKVTIKRGENEEQMHERFSMELYKICYNDPKFGEFLMHIAQISTLQKYKDEQAKLIHDANDLAFLSSTMYDALNKTKSGRSKLDFIYAQLDHAFKVLVEWMAKSEFGNQISKWIVEKENENKKARRI